MKILNYEEYDQPIYDGGQVVRFIWCEEMNKLNAGDYIELGNIGHIYQVLDVLDEYIAILEI